MKFFLLILVFCQTTFARLYKCELNTAPSGKTYSVAEAANYVRVIDFDSDTKDGKVLKFNDQNVFIWKKDNFINIKYQDNAKNFVFATSFLSSRDSFSFNVEPNNLFKCVYAKVEKEKIPTAINSTDDLSLLKENLTIKVLVDLKFLFYQSQANDRMRAVIFQDGRLYSLDSERDKEGDWCIFNIQVKLDEDTFISKGSKFKVEGFTVLSNNERRNVFAYDFVNIAEGKKVSENSRYVPFSMECNLAKDKLFTMEYFKKITGNRLSISVGN